MDDFARWVVRPRPRPDAATTLLCIPFAGAGTGVYHGWADLLPPEVELWLLRPPGRETRLRERPYTELDDLVADAARALAPTVNRPLVVFGHSLGAVIGFELARRLRRVTRLLVSGLAAPHLPAPPPVGHLPAVDLLDALAARYQQVPRELRDDPEIQALYLPVLRADLLLWERHRHRAGPPLDCPVTAIGGEDDASCPVDTLAAWRVHTTGEFTLRMVKGGHFNFNTPDERLRMVASVVDELTGIRAC